LSFKNVAIETFYQLNIAKAVCKYGFKHQQIAVITFLVLGLLSNLYPLAELGDPHIASNIIFFLTFAQGMLCYLRWLHLQLLRSRSGNVKASAFIQSRANRYLIILVPYLADGAYGYASSILLYTAQTVLLLFSSYGDCPRVAEAFCQILIMYIGFLECASVPFIAKAATLTLLTAYFTIQEFSLGRLTVYGLGQNAACFVLMALSISTLTISMKKNFILTTVLEYNNAKLDEGWCFSFS
jgi:hypothetical protein